MTVRLWCGGEVLEVDASLAEQAAPRVHVAAFTSSSSRVPALTVVRRPGVEGMHLHAPLGHAVIRRSGALLEIDVSPDGPFPAELALRLGYYLVTVQLGGVLVHASAVASASGAAVACGPSGAGKSTLARLGVAAGLSLLSDEVVMLFPDGRVGGSPFRSDSEQPGSPELRAGRHFFTLVKAGSESIALLRPMDAAAIALAQAFDVDHLSLPRPEVNRRVLGFLGQVQLGALHFRKDPAAGAFLAGRL